MEPGLQQAESTFKSMLSDIPIDKQQQLNEEVAEVETEIEEEEPEIEAEADAEVEAEEDEQEELEEQPDEPQYHRVKLDGVEMEVTLDEMKSSYMRQQDYTKKTQAVAKGHDLDAGK